MLLSKAYPDSRVAVPHAATCHFIAWLGGTGIPFPLILATILVKMLRIFAIVQKPLSYKKNFFTSYTLLLYICILLSPTILILTLWSSIDPLVIIEVSIPVKRGQQIIEICLSTHTTVWLILPYVYAAILIAAVVIVGIKTSSVRYKHFQDANATNIFAFVAVTVAILGNVFGNLFVIIQPSAENYIGSELSVSISALAIVISCQMLLFFPKVCLPIRRWLYRNEVRKKPITSTLTDKHPITSVIAI